MKTYLFVTNDAWFFTSHRLPIARALVARGARVIVAARPDHTVSEIESAGCIFEPWKVSPRGRSLLGEVLAVYSLTRIVWRQKPSLIHLITIKPVLYGGILSRVFRVSACVYAVSGLGSVFLTDTKKADLLRVVIRPLYRFAISHRNSILIFQNKDDRELLLRQLSKSELPTRMIRGSGVDLALFTKAAEPTGRLVVTLAARLLKDKGILEFAEAAELINSRGIDALFQLAGGNVADGNPAAFSPEELEQLEADENILMLGHISNIPSLFEQTNIVVLPSYREGLPKVLVEAGAMGRAVVTTNVPGCRDAVIADKTALLVPPGNAKALADAIHILLEDEQLRAKLGAAGRQLVASSMSIDTIIDNHLNIYDELLERQK